MPWVRIEDDFYDHPKFDKAGPLGMALWVAGLAWANRNLSDGFIPRSRAHTLLDYTGLAFVWSGELVGGGNDVEPHMIVDALVDAGLWELAEGGYQVHDYLRYQPSAATVRKDRKKVSTARKEAGRRGAANRWQTDGKPNGNGDGKPMANEEQTEWQTDGPNPNPNPSKNTRPSGRFDEFYEGFPRKEAKIAAEKAWKAKTKAGVDPQALIDACANYAIVARGKEREFVMLPTTFINGRWMDYTESPKSATTSYDAPPTRYT